MATAAAEKPARPKGLKLLAVALRNRRSATMLAFGFSSGLPFSLLVGTLTAWLGEVGVKLATIGIFSWIGLAYSFKFLWSPVVDRLHLPGLERLGRRKSWIALGQVIIGICLALLALTNPAVSIGNFVLVAFVAALASASHDIAIDGWRIDQADERAPIELLSSIYQCGYRSASIVGGAIALVMAARMSWPNVYLVMGGVFIALLAVTLTAPDSPRPEKKSLYGALAEPGALKLAVGHPSPDHLCRVDTDARGARRQSAVGSGLHQDLGRVDHRRDSVRAVGGCRSGKSIGTQPRQGASGAGFDPRFRPHVDEPPLFGAGRSARRAVAPDELGRARGDRLHPDLRNLLQYLGELRVPVLPRLSEIFEGRGRLRLEDLRYHHDHGGHQPWGISVRQDRPLSHHPARCDPATARQLPLCGPRSGRADDRRICAHRLARSSCGCLWVGSQDDAAAPGDLLREHRNRPRAHRLRRLRFQHRQQ